jgi:hypothetical protein
MDEPSTTDLAIRDEHLLGRDGRMHPRVPRSGRS